MCEICQRRPASVFMLVRNENDAAHVGKAHACLDCFEEMQRQAKEIPPAGVAWVATMVEEVSQQDYNNTVEGWPGKGEALEQ
jgi:hypothetical protein